MVRERVGDAYAAQKRLYAWQSVFVAAGPPES
jgi:hypothetical protein